MADTPALRRRTVLRALALTPAAALGGHRPPPAAAATPPAGTVTAPARRHAHRTLIGVI